MWLGSYHCCQLSEELTMSFFFIPFICLFIFSAIPHYFSFSIFIRRLAIWWYKFPSICLSYSFFWFICESSSGSWQSSILCTLFGETLAFMGFFKTTRNIYCLSWLKPDKILERTFLKISSMVRCWPNWKLIVKD